MAEAKNNLKHILYAVKDYNTADMEFIKNGKKEMNLEDAIKALNEDKYYHFRIENEGNYIFFGDLDKLRKPLEEFEKNLLTFLVKKYGIIVAKEDIKYTKNNVTEGSYHYSIPRLWGSVKKLKEIHTNFKKEYDSTFRYKDCITKKVVSCIDTTIYSNHWFRCPNQSKGNSTLKTNNKHLILSGCMEDFIVTNIREDSMNIDSKEYIDNKDNNDTKKKLAKTNKLNMIEPTTKELEMYSDKKEIVLYKENDNVLSSTLTQPVFYKKVFDECYKQERFDNYEYWVPIGMAIKNTFMNEDEAFELFNYFSSKGNNYEGLEKTKTKYRTFIKKKDGGFTIATINFYAIEDNKAKYTELMSKNSFELGQTDICKYLKVIGGYRFIYKSDENYKIYCYNGTRWVSDAVILRDFISTELYSFLKKILIEIYWNSKEFNLLKGKIEKLKTIGYKREIIETYKEYGTNDDVKFDNKWWLFGFNNLVYDMKEQTFREYKYDDYVSITTGYNWREPTDEEIETVMDLIKKIMPIEEERELYLEILATGMEGKCLEKFVVFNGSGGNGKGVGDDLTKTTYGNYAMIGNNGILFEKSKTGTNPEKANIHKKRLVIFREPPEKSKFENSQIKELTGGGTFSARTHHEKEAEKTLHLTLLAECNDKPLFAEEPKEAEVRRIIDIKFRSEFKTDTSLLDDSKHIYMANPYYKTDEFKDKHKFALFKILTKYQKKFMDNNSILSVPESINLRTQLYLELSCNLVSWFKENYVMGKKTDYIKIKDVHEKFSQSEYFMTLSKTERRKYTKAYFQEYFEKNIFFKKYYSERHDNIRHVIKGWIDKPDEDDD